MISGQDQKSQFSQNEIKGLIQEVKISADQLEVAETQGSFVREFDFNLGQLKSQLKIIKDKEKSFQDVSEAKRSNQQHQSLANQLKQLCNKTVNKLDEQIKCSLDERLHILYLTKKAEIKRQLLVLFPLDKQKPSVQEIEESYLDALKLIKQSKNEAICRFEETISLKSALNYSLFLTEVLNDSQRTSSLMSQIIEKRRTSLTSEIKPFKIWDSLKIHYQSIKGLHLKDLLTDNVRNQSLFARFEQIIFDYSHQKITIETLEEFRQLLENANLWQKIQSLFNEQHTNFTQNRAVLHTALRAPIKSELHSSKASMRVIQQNVHKVLKDIDQFSRKVRSGEWIGATGKKLNNLIVIGIGGSYLSVEFVYEALRSHPAYKQKSFGRTIRFLANVDPIDFNRAVQGLNVESTLILVNSKTFTTAETMLNARSCKQWLINEFSKLGMTNQKLISERHICACSTNLKETEKFGIKSQNVFGFWDFVGGRFSVWSCVGILPLSIHFGFEVMEGFLAGGHSIDRHLLKQRKLQKNIPLLLGLLGFYRTTIQGYTARAIIPYCQALCKFAPHVQQLDMESNGKRVNSKGEQLDYETAVVNYGEPGTNGQHSFFQLLHQGRSTPVEFIGFTKSQQPFNVSGNVSNHDELMSNFFSQPDALAQGKAKDQLKKEGVPDNLIAHKEFEGDRPSSSFLFLAELNAYNCGQLLAIYEHRTSIEGFLWDINSYDQYGVQLGKVLAKNVREILKSNGELIKQAKNSASEYLISQYIGFK